MARSDVCGRTVRRAAVSLAAVWSVAILCSLCPGGVEAFNVDVDHIVRYSGRNSDDMFGFSVALHKEARSGDSWVLVGAPQAQSEWQRAVRRGGAVYRCHIASAQCAQVPFDQSDGNNHNATGHDIDNKSHQWFGATVAAAESGAAVVACAPRYVYYPNTREERHDPVGTCWVAQERFGRFNEYSPCRTSEWGYHRKGHCQAGLGASISKDGTQLFVGAPGSHYWQGQLFTVDATKFMPFLPPESIRVNATAGQLFVENLHRRPEVYETLEGPSTDDDTYLGYSVAVGYFDGNERNTSVAVGRPRGDYLQGKVEIYTWDLIQFVDISGEQLGAYFGYSLCASDMDGDGKDDLVVGAPLYTERNNEGKYETGRIYVFYQRGDYERNSSRDGINSRSRFGLSVASLGDINRDGYGDIAVGAPYDSPEGRGAVYIYLGSSEGIRAKSSQVIHAKDVSRSLSTFGFSLSGGLDLDNNYYPDLVVGAYESNSAAFFRARPIVKVNATVKFINTSKQINLKNHNCKIQGSENNAICFGVSSCIIFDGLGVDNGHEFNVTITLDAAKPRSSRMFFQDSQKNSISFPAWAVKNTMYCRPFNVYIKSNIRDKLTPLEVEMRYSLQPPRAQTRSLAPVLDLVRPPVKKDTLHIAKNCGADNICIPDLKMKVEPSVEEYFLGSGEDFKLRVLVHNNREDAFEATYSLKIPLGLNYKNIARLDKNNDVTIQCSPPTAASNNTLLCDIGNPLSSKKHVEFEVLMQPSYAEGLRSHYDFEMEVNSTNPEKDITKDDNKLSFRIPINIQTDLSLMGASFPSDVHWNSIDYSKTEGFKEEAEIGPQVVHVHKIRNNGRVNIVKAEVYLVVPTSTFADDNILYLLEQPNTKGNIKCDAIEANFLSLKLENRRISYLEGQERLTGTIDQSASKESASSSSSSSSSSQSGSASIQGQRSRGSLHEDDAPSEGGRRGGSVSHQETYHAHGGTHRLVGVDEERVIHRDEGLENSGRGTFGQAGSGFYQQSSHSFQNESRTSQHVETQSGSSGPVVHKSTNYSASWNKDGGPLHQYENHTSESGGQVQTSETHHNGRGHGGVEQHSARGRAGASAEYDSRTHYSSSSGSQSSQAERAQGAGERHSSGGRTGGSAEYEARTRYSSSSSSQSGQAERAQGAGERGGTGRSVEYESRTRYSSSSGSQSGQAERAQGADEHHSTGGRTGGSAEYESRTHYSSSSGSQAGQAERGNSGVNQTSTRIYSSGGSHRDNTDVYRDNTGESHYNARDYSDREGRYDNTGYRDNTDYRNNERTYEHAGGSHISQSGYQENENTGYYDRDSHDNNEGYESEGGDYDRRQDIDRTQGQNRSQGTFRHSWSTSGGNQYQSNAGHGTQWSSGRDNVDRDNVDENERHVDGQYGTLDHRSRERTHQYGDNDYNAGEISHSSSNHHRTSNSQQSSSGWSQSGTSYTYDQDYRGGGYGDESSRDANIHQHLSSNWDSEQSRGAGQSQGSDHYSSASASTSGRDQRINQNRDQAQRGTGQFYTSSVLLGAGGDVDLGYAARGYGQHHGSSSSSNSRHYANEEHRRTTVDPDLTDLGAQFTNEPQGSQRHGSHRDEDGEGHLRLYDRYRRSVPDSSVAELLKCNATNCTRIHCTLGPLPEGEDALIELRMRVWVPTMKKLKDNRIIKTSSRMILHVTELPHIGTPHEPIVRDHEVFTDVVSTDSPTIPDIVPLWVVVLSAVAGTIILLLLIFLLWKCGFFKRNRPADAAEKEPLNRNGHYSAGDEAL